MTQDIFFFFSFNHLSPIGSNRGFISSDQEENLKGPEDYNPNQKANISFQLYLYIR